MSDLTPADPVPGDNPQRVHKLLAAWGVASRRHCEVLIQQGRVTVDGAPAHIGLKVRHDALIRVDGVRVGPQAPQYLMLNKPTGVVTTAHDPQGRRTVLDLVAAQERVYPVGRLDIDTTGLLLLTNDGELTHRLTHPSFGVEKLYTVLVDGTVSARHVTALRDGVELEDGITAPARVRVVGRAGERTLVEIAIHEGRNRQVRRMFEAIGHPVCELARIAYGPLKLGDLRSGAARALSAAEIRRLNKAAGRAPARARTRGQGAEGGSDVRR